MKSFKHLPSMLSIVFVIASLSVSVLGQTADDRNQPASISSFGSSIRFDVPGPHAAVTLTVLAPDGQSFTKEFQAGNVVEFKLTDSKGERLPDGQYVYELRVTPIIASEVREALRAARASDKGAEVQREMRRRGQIPSHPLVQSGGFQVVNGSIVTPGAVEENRGPARAMVTEQPAAPAPVVASARRSGYKVQRHHPRFMVFDQVIPDDLIVQGSACFGFDCVLNEGFGTDTIKLKENNTRITFDDTSTSAGFAANNWQIRANDQPTGGVNYLGIVDLGATGTGETGTVVVAVDAGALANSIRVGTNSKVGFRTATPGLDIHAHTSDTPAIRLEQNNTGGFSAQTWDIGANEANFFVRDLTGGSRLSFRIRPGAPTSSIDISASGNVGIGTASPGTILDVQGNAVTIGSDLNATTRTTGTIKLSRITAPPFTTGNLNFAFVAGATTATENIAGIGGAATGFSAATSIVFHTAGSTNTDFGTERMRINSTGQVGIGTTAPDQLLSVNGNASKVGGGSWLSFSDERLKNFRGRFTTGLEAVMKLQPLRFQYRPKNAVGIQSEAEYVGFGAQAVQQVIPEAVQANADGYLMVNNDPIIWTMLNAIKEQQAQIVELKRQVRQLRAATRRRR